MTNKETKKFLQSFIDGDRLRRYVVLDIVDGAESGCYEGNLEERLRAKLQDVSNGGQNGSIASLTYYHETLAFFKKFKKEIIALVQNTARELGQTSGAFLSDLRGWDNDDPFCKDTTNRQLLAWFAYEEIAYRLSMELENI